MDFSLFKTSPIRKSAPQVSVCALAVIGSIFMLSACATVSQTECVDIPWHEQGVIAGAQGMSASVARQNFESCGVRALLAERNAYIAGYREGIENYCTKANGFQAGVEGATYQDVCPENTEESFLVGYRAGSDLFLADYDLRAAKLAFASIPSSFIGTPPSAEHNRFKLETFPQTRDTARALISQTRWQQPGPSNQVLQRAYGKRDLSTVIERCEAAKKQAGEQGFVVDDAC